METKNILLADSGSTKTEWCLISPKSKEQVQHFFSDGLNPFYHTPESIQDVLRYAVKPNLADIHIDSIYFYGSGCSLDEKKKMIHVALSNLFADCTIEVQDDLLGAARAVCNTSAGIACILGTGSNSCLFDGTTILDTIPSLGFVLGDEGSGGYIGKQLIHSYFYRDMPQDLRLEMEKTFTMERRVILDGVYYKPQSNRFVASFAAFTSTHKSHPFIQNLIKNAFDTFLNSMIFKYEGYKNIPIGFIGSVAYSHQDIMISLLQDYGLSRSRFIKNPMETLIDYHRI